MSDRGMIKWIPFDSVISSKSTVNRLAKEKVKVKMPTLSEEQLTTIENNLKESFYLKEEITIIYYKNNKYLKKTSTVKEIDSSKRLIILNDNTKIYFAQIIKITIN